MGWDVITVEYTGTMIVHLLLICIYQSSGFRVGNSVTTASY